MIASVCKHHVTKMPCEIGRLAQNLASGMIVTMPSEKDFRNEAVGGLLEKYLKGRADVSTENRMLESKNANTNNWRAGIRITSERFLILTFKEVFEDK